MSALTCPYCGYLLQFESRHCSNCGRTLAFDPATGGFRRLNPGRGGWVSGAGDEADGALCDNSRLGVCNWFVPAEDVGLLCRSCSHNRTIPDLSVPGVLQRWRKIEDAKRRMVWGLLRLGLPLDDAPACRYPLSFDLLYDSSAEAGLAPEHPTGYLSGRITLNLVEADDAARERIRHQMGEPYRTLVGHFRHEMGHHYWQMLVAETDRLEPFRHLFGDERADYAVAVQNYYRNRPQGGWEGSHVSAYATMHPWEDFAETFAHFLHIVDTLAAIASLGMSLGPPLDLPGGRATIDFDPCDADTAALVRAWGPFAFALNGINRSMGQPDIYPFSLTPVVVLKLDFVNRLVAEAAGRVSKREERPGLDAMIAALDLTAAPRGV